MVVQHDRAIHHINGILWRLTNATLPWDGYQGTLAFYTMCIDIHLLQFPVTTKCHLKTPYEFVLEDVFFFGGIFFSKNNHQGVILQGGSHLQGWRLFPLMFKGLKQILYRKYWLRPVGYCYYTRWWQLKLFLENFKPDFFSNLANIFFRWVTETTN